MSFIPNYSFVFHCSLHILCAGSVHIYFLVYWHVYIYMYSEVIYFTHRVHVCVLSLHPPSPLYPTSLPPHFLHYVSSTSSLAFTCFWCFCCLLTCHWPSFLPLCSSLPSSFLSYLLSELTSMMMQCRRGSLKKLLMHFCQPLIPLVWVWSLRQR